MDRSIEQRRFHPIVRRLVAGGLAVGLNIVVVGCGSSTNRDGIIEARGTVSSPGSVVNTLGKVSTTTLPESITPGTQAPETTTTAPETTTTSTTEKKKRQQNIISDGVGNIYIGQSKTEVDASYAISSTCGGEEYSVEDAPADIAVSFDSQDKVKQVTVYGLGVETEAGIEIGSKGDDVLKAYSANDRPTTSLYQGSNGTVDFLVVAQEDANLNFMITPKDGAKRVTSIIVTPPGQPAILACD